MQRLARIQKVCMNDLRPLAKHILCRYHTGQVEVTVQRWRGLVADHQDREGVAGDVEGHDDRGQQRERDLQTERDAAITNRDDAVQIAQEALTTADETRATVAQLRLQLERQLSIPCTYILLHVFIVNFQGYFLGPHSVSYLS
jgi:hypothetical protein